MHAPTNLREPALSSVLSFFGVLKKRRKLNNRVPLEAFAKIVSSALAISVFSVVSPASAALIVDANNATFSFINRTTVSGSGNGDKNNDVQKFTNVATINGIAIDSVVTTTIVNSGGVAGQLPKITTYDPGSTANYLDLDVSATSGSDFYGYINLNFKFYEGGTYSGPGTGNQLTLQNLNVFSLDIDSGNQFSDFKGFQSFRVNNPTRLRYTGGANSIPANLDASSPFVRFLSGSGASGSNNVQDQVEVKYLSTDDFDVRVGNAAADGAAYFAIGFGVAPWGANPTLTTTNNPRNTAPTSSNTSKYVPTTGSVILNRADFGNYSDADSNPFSKVKITALPTAGTLQYLNGSTWTPVTAGSYINVSAIDAGELRLVMSSTAGTTDANFKFAVNDSLADSVEYIFTLNVSPTPQTITFANPGTQSPGTSPNFTSVASGATASSQLTVSLTSKTTGICSINGLNIVSTGVVGLCEVEATQVGDTTYSAAPNVVQSFYFDSNAAQTINFTNPGDQPLSSGSVVVTATASSTLTVALTSLSASVCTVSSFTVTLVASGTCTIRANQAGGTAGQTTYGPASPVTISFLVTATNPTITFDANDSSGNTGTQSVNNGVATALNSNIFARSGYAFDVWNTAANGSGTSYADGANITLASNITLYAQWRANAPVVIPDPVQTDEVIEINPKEGPAGQVVVISGRFNRTISNITLNGAFLPQGSWTQTPSTVTLTIPAGYRGNVFVQIYNGAVPLLKSVEYKVLEIVPNPKPIAKEKPSIVWPTPAPIVEGTKLSNDQLNAKASIPGKYEYVNALGEILPNGKQKLKLRFVPDDLTKYEVVDVEVEIEVRKAINPAVTPIVIPANIKEQRAITNLSKDAKAIIKEVGKGLQEASMLPGLQVLVHPYLNFSGKTQVLVTVSDDGQTVDVVVPVTVLPLVPETRITQPIAFKTTKVSWEASPNAVSYEVLIEGNKACETKATNCEVNALVGPKTKVEVLAKGNDETLAPLALASYRNPDSPVLAAVKNFATAKFDLRPSVRKELREFAEEVKAAGFTRLQVQGHTDIRGGVDNTVLSRNRAQATIDFLKKLLPDVKFKIGYFASTQPAADNSTKEGLAANRRVEIALW